MLPTMTSVPSLLSGLAFMSSRYKPAWLMQATDEAAELRTRLTRTEANLQAVHNEAADGERALSALQEELQKLQGALAQAVKVQQAHSRA